MIDSSNKEKEELNIQELGELSSFFDLLARFDHEDRQKEKSGAETDLLVSAPKRPVLGSDI